MSTPAEREAAQQTGTEPTPTVGRQVHYVSYGTPGGEYTSECRAATITEVRDGHIGLAVLNPTGLFFHSIGHENGPCPHVEPGSGVEVTGGSWHWPERA